MLRTNGLPELELINLVLANSISEATMVSEIGNISRMNNLSDIHEAIDGSAIDTTSSLDW